jgi:hypothetical protein
MRYIKKYEKISSELEELEEREDFVDYMMTFYGPDGIIDFFKGKLTRNVVEKYVDDFIKKRKELRKWEGDTLDREYFRDVLFVKLGMYKLGEIEYRNEIRPYLTDLEIDVNNYNL